ncbi:MAG: FixH family protein [Pseudomonadota bacterium]
MTREFTGWHMLALMVGGFGIIITVNLTLAYNAVATFPGVEARNSYAVSQEFQAKRAAQNALNWDVEASLVGGLLTVAITDKDGNPVQAEVTRATFGRATHTGEDSVPAFTWNGRALTAPVAAGDGYWNLRLELVAPDGTQFRRRFPLTAQ